MTKSDGSEKFGCVVRLIRQRGAEHCNEISITSDCSFPAHVEARQADRKHSRGGRISGWITWAFAMWGAYVMRAQRAEASLRRVQAEVAHVSSVTTLGELTASIAHEVTQSIGSARDNARATLNFLDRQPPNVGEAKQTPECVVGDADRVGNIIDRARDHIKEVPPRQERFDLNEAINEVTFAR